MKAQILTLGFLISTLVAGAQAKKVLLEEFTGAHCGNCPMGSYYVDSMLTKYPDVIAVSLHAYQPSDAMDFIQIDSFYNTYSAGAPLGNVDRVYWGGGWMYVAQPMTYWDAYIQQRLAVDPLLTVEVMPFWDSATRAITAHVNVSILTDLPSGDYRMNVYVVEDSVTGTGSGYDQKNYYNTTVGNPFYGLGDPIEGFVHRHVVRAILPSCWGIEGVIPEAPAAGENFSDTFSYLLPESVNEDRTSLIAFISKFTGNHLSDEVFNADEKKLLEFPTGMEITTTSNSFLKVYPNPANDKLFVEVENSDFEIAEFILRNQFGREAMRQNLLNNSGQLVFDVSVLQPGLYIICATVNNMEVYRKKIMISR